MLALFLKDLCFIVLMTVSGDKGTVQTLLGPSEHTGRSSLSSLRSIILGQSYYSGHLPLVVFTMRL